LYEKTKINEKEAGVGPFFKKVLIYSTRMGKLKKFKIT